MPDYKHISSEELLVDSFKLGKNIYDSGFRPDFIVALWRGGTPVGIAVQEFFEYHNISTDHIAIRTSSYSDIDKKEKEIRVHGLDYLHENLKKNHKLLLVDDVFDSGLTVKAVLETLKEVLREDFPEEIKVGVVYYKTKRNKTDMEPDFYIHKTDEWIVFPHELKGLEHEDIKKKNSHIYEILNS